MNIKKLTPQLLLALGFTLGAISASAQTPQADINLTIRPAQTPEERVNEEFKLKELRKAAEEKLAAEEAARLAETMPKALLSKARIVYISSNTSFFEVVQLQNALRKREEFDRWQMAIVDGANSGVADVVIEVDRPLFTYTFTYTVTSRNGIVLSTGKITAFDGDAAAPKLAARLIEEIKLARGEAPPKK
jgi:hypothetical protein